jgi:hypothetical protein
MKSALICILALAVVVVDFRFYFLSLLIDAVLIGGLLFVIFKWPTKNKS